MRPTERKLAQCFNFYFIKKVSPFSNQLLQKGLPLVTEEASHLVEVSLSDKGEDFSEALNVDNGLSTGRTDLGRVGVGRDKGMMRHQGAQRQQSQTSGRAADSSRGAAAPSLGGCS